MISEVNATSLLAIASVRNNLPSNIQVSHSSGVGIGVDWAVPKPLVLVHVFCPINSKPCDVTLTRPDIAGRA